MPIENRVNVWLRKSDSGNLVINIGNISFTCSKKQFLRMLKGEIKAVPMALIVPEEEEEDEVDEEVAEEMEKLGEEETPEEDSEEEEEAD